MEKERSNKRKKAESFKKELNKTRIYYDKTKRELRRVTRKNKNREDVKKSARCQGRTTSWKTHFQCGQRIP